MPALFEGEWVRLSLVSLSNVARLGSGVFRRMPALIDERI
jgi:hypothetical protein